MMVAILQLKASKLIVYFVSFTVVIFTILKIISKKEIAPIKILEHILITLCQLRGKAGSREYGRCQVISRCYLKRI